MLEAANDHGLPVAAVAASFGVAWWTTQATINSAAESLPDVDSLHVAQLRVDERRYQKVATPTSRPGRSARLSRRLGCR